MKERKQGEKEKNKEKIKEGKDGEKKRTGETVPERDGWMEKNKNKVKKLSAFKSHGNELRGEKIPGKR